MNTKQIIYLFVSLFLCHVVYGDKCSTPLKDIKFQNLSLYNLIKSHDDTEGRLSNWVYFFFNRIRDPYNVVTYMKILNINTINVEDQPCFIKAFNIYMIHAHAGKILGLEPPKIGNFDAKEYSYIKDYCKDFLWVAETKSVHKHLNELLLSKNEIDNAKLDLSLIKNLITKASIDTPAKFIDDPMKYLEEMNLVEDIDDPYMDASKLASRDYKLLAILGLKNHYYNADLTQPIRKVRDEIESIIRLWFRKRSKLFPLYKNYLMSDGHAKISKYDIDCYPSLDDFVQGFFSAIKEKMVKIHIRFLDNFTLAMENKSYKVNGLKGLRYLKSLFQRKTFPNFVKLNSDYISSELTFLKESFFDVFDSTLDCYTNQYLNFPGDKYLDTKMHSQS
ncbi:hypothetical protein YYC_05327 [Plasmodium yoelii 17X]|uniref:Rhoptry-associated protein 2/3 n=4 Tax=Plasmodium yoelii TaxID=5861 RepID=A0AAE9WR54_PLAYO|nr:uncharacterized protein PY17X_1102500 [Plasmodium yoelii]EAA15706.1 RAP2, putative [Plasmodium yoelii yoelii]ETB56979.1 hypothetical protein YYC_05327 [Plasmodium yoelii 17X]WBY58391.1 rhoptry-associated protein 2/3 [Plasmodium yoelii yoelii]CDU18719.1 rhoptry-associated protein 2/3 [Plasmodium yoelii]VTZ79304.1 rhoptry-associated protein 2/3 [Plasmodium yoelii]|eukprot:XP_724141.1 uncharacterized protein PY17X_1102500 [Plasmodium yoelii]